MIRAVFHPSKTQQNPTVVRTFRRATAGDGEAFGLRAKFLEKQRIWADERRPSLPRERTVRREEGKGTLRWSAL